MARPVGFGGLSHEEIALKLGVTVRVVKTAERRALRKMRKAVKSGWSTESCRLRER